MIESVLPRSQKIDRTADLANCLLTDIKQRRLNRGDRYLTTEQAGLMLQVSKASANLAMQLLANQNVLVRRQRSGTFIGPAIRSQEEGADEYSANSQLNAICVVHSSYRTVSATQIVTGIHEKLPGIEIQFIFLPRYHRIEFLNERLKIIQSSGQRVGFLLLSCAQDVYRFFAEQEAPAAVIGEVYRDSQSLPSVNGDASGAGRLLIDHLLQQGHFRIALLTYSHWRPGDNLFYEGISRGMAATDLAHDSLVMRSLPNDAKDFGHEAAILLAGADPPTAIICRTCIEADAITKAATKAGFTVPDDVSVVFGWGTEYSQGNEECLYPHVRVCPSFGRHAALAADTINRIHEGKSMLGKRVVLPVELVVPKR